MHSTLSMPSMPSMLSLTWLIPLSQWRLHWLRRLASYYAPTLIQRLIYSFSSHTILLSQILLIWIDIKNASMLINICKMEPKRQRGMDPKGAINMDSDLKPSTLGITSATELKPQLSAKHGTNFEQFCQDRVSAMQASSTSLVSPASSSYSSLVSKSMPGTKHTIDAILGLRRSQTLINKLHSNDNKPETNCSERSECESIGSNSKPGNDQTIWSFVTFAKCLSSLWWSAKLI